MMLTVDILKDHAFLNCLDENGREWLFTKAVTRKYGKGHQVVKAGEKDANFFLVNAGYVRVTLFSVDGKEISFVDIGPGGNFGELSAIDGKPRSANVVTLCDTEITVVPPHVFREILNKFPQAGLELLHQLATVVRRLCDRIYEYSTLGVCNRINLELLRLSAQNIDLDGVARIKNPPTQLEMASRVSCTREAVSREYKRLEMLGIIHRKPKTLVVENLQGLQALVDEALT